MKFLMKTSILRPMLILIRLTSKVNELKSRFPVLNFGLKELENKWNALPPWKTAILFMCIQAQISVSLCHEYLTKEVKRWTKTPFLKRKKKSLVFLSRRSTIRKTFRHITQKRKVCLFEKCLHFKASEFYIPSESVGFV